MHNGLAAASNSEMCTLVVQVMSRISNILMCDEIDIIEGL